MKRGNNSLHVILTIICIVFLVTTSYQFEKSKSDSEEKIENLQRNIDALRKEVGLLELSINQAKEIAHESEILIDCSIQRIAQRRHEWIGYLTDIDEYFIALEKATTIIKQNSKENGGNLEKELHSLEEELIEARKKLRIINPSIEDYYDQNSSELDLKY